MKFVHTRFVCAEIIKKTKKAKRNSEIIPDYSTVLHAAAMSSNLSKTIEEF